MPDLDLDGEESFIVGRLVSADVIEHETDHVPDYGNYCHDSTGRVARLELVRLRGLLLLDVIHLIGSVHGDAHRRGV
jgi:hypothetical protein